LAARLAGALGLAALVAGCAGAPSQPTVDQVRLPLLRGWYEAEEVFYVTTDVSNADLAQAKGANFAPRLASALSGAGAGHPARGTAVDKVYGVTNDNQASVFASAPDPIGHRSRSVAYSPLWQLIKVTWIDGAQRRTLRSEEEVLGASERGEVRLEATPVVLNCPIIHRRAPGGTLPGVVVGPALR
jgi:hypothetical protein